MNGVRARVAQLSDTHIVSSGTGYFGIDTERYLRDALAEVHALDPVPDYIVVTGDLVNQGTPAQYARFREIMSSARLPYFVIPGNHDDAGNMRAELAPETYGNAPADSRHYAIEDFAIRLVGLDCNVRRPWPGAVADRATCTWLERTLAARGPDRATIVAVHQPPFRTGLRYVDAGGFLGSDRLRAVVDRHPNVRALITGHIHCIREARWNHAVASSAPSSAPQKIPLVFMQGRVLGVVDEAAGFAIHDLHDDGTFARTDVRRNAEGRYEVHGSAAAPKRTLHAEVRRYAE